MNMLRNKKKTEPREKKSNEKETWTLTEIICSFLSLSYDFRQFIFNLPQVQTECVCFAFVSWHRVFVAREWRAWHFSVYIFLFYFFHWFWFNLLLFFAASAVVHFMFLAFSPVFFCRLPKNKVVDIDATDKKIIHGNCMEFYVFLMARRRGWPNGRKIPKKKKRIFLRNRNSKYLSLIYMFCRMATTDDCNQTVSDEQCTEAVFILFAIHEASVRTNVRCNVVLLTLFSVIRTIKKDIECLCMSK